MPPRPPALEALAAELDHTERGGGIPLLRSVFVTWEAAAPEWP